MSESIVKNLNAPLLHNEEKNNNKFTILKTDKPVRIYSKDIALDDTFQELETTRDHEGNIINTRFSKEIQSFIRDYLMAKNISFDDTGYLSLRSACYSLKYDERLELCRNIKYKFDKDVDIDDRLKKSNSFFDRLKKDSSMISGGALIGTAAGAGANIINPNLIPEKIGEIGKDVIGNEIEKNAGLISGPIKDFANNFINNNVLTQTLPINLVSGALGGIAVGTVGAAVSSLYNIVKNCVKRIDSKKANKLFIEKDNELYKEENEEEAKLIAANVQKETGQEIEGFQTANVLA